MPSVRKFALHYDVLNGQGTFSEGDTITGNVRLSLERPTRVMCVAVKVKGDADVQWTERAGNEDKCYSEHKRFFGFKKHLIPEKSKDTLLSEGTHRYNFRFQIPPGNLPSSFQGKHGKIVYLLEAKLSRSWKMDRKVIKELKFVSKSIPNIRPLMLSSKQFPPLEKWRLRPKANTY
ncbi:arrestin domain-containing protein 3-like [Lampris incognitus]|uniref:arrestin domain-containing protein 3-like n=1 Tax=Lampris incognitus TaxID=2546036 RepID=UPI0024B48AF8|nr:arrestin domain-containing protein 3-like [Lampris incognitus]